MEKQFTQEDLVSFGNFLLSEERRHAVVSNPSNGYAPTDGFVARGNGSLSLVSDADLSNWEHNRAIENMKAKALALKAEGEAILAAGALDEEGLNNPPGIEDDPSRFDDGLDEPIATVFEGGFDLDPNADLLPETQYKEAPNLDADGNDIEPNAATGEEWLAEAEGSLREGSGSVQQEDPQPGNPEI